MESLFLFLTDEENEAHVQRYRVTFVSDKGRFHYKYFASKSIFFPTRESGETQKRERWALLCFISTLPAYPRLGEETG